MLTLVPKDRHPLDADGALRHVTLGDGRPLAPHALARLGTRILRVIPRAIVIVGNVEEWEAWRGLRMPDRATTSCRERSRR